jgi:diguanylate cyclase (GGDEF)-like protein/PAS domain S-box-containing protein
MRERLQTLVRSDSAPRALAAAAAMFAGVCAWRFADPNPGSAIGTLYVVPIALLAVRFDKRGGIAGACLGTVLFALWALTTHAGVEPSGYVVRGASFFAVALIVATQVERRHSVEREADRWFSMSDELCCVAGLDGYFTRVNSSWTECLGYTEEELLSRPYYELVHPEDLERTRGQAVSLADPEYVSVHFENRYRAKDGTWHWLLWSSRSDGKQIYAAARDITDRKHFEGQLETLASEDTLTGIGNRRAWEERCIVELRRAARSGEPLSIAMLDVDDLKAVNDSHGHAAGDRLLRGTAAAGGQAIRATDFIARLGGDEFGLLLPNCTGAGAEEVLARMLRLMPTGQMFSAGVATWDGHEQLASLVARADAALYDDKPSRGHSALTEADH